MQGLAQALLTLDTSIQLGEGAESAAKRARLSTPGSAMLAVLLRFPLASPSLVCPFCLQLSFRCWSLTLLP